MKNNNPILAVLLLVLSSTSLAEEPGDVLMQEIYPEGGSTLYCDTRFEPGDRVKVDTIYPQKTLLRHFDCITTRQCAGKPGFEVIFNDLHNHYPVTRSSELARRGSLFGDLPENLEPDDCGIRSSFQTFHPPAHARGNVARAMLYMHREHDLPLQGPLEMYRRWNQADPPDEVERLRNNLIDRIQHRRNPFIDRPALMDELETVR